MPVYLLVEIKVKDAEVYAQYIARVRETVELYGGRYLVRGGKVVRLSGDWEPERVILMEFPGWEQLSTWAGSPEYAAVAPLRERSADTRAIAVEGYAPDDA